MKKIKTAAVIAAAGKGKRFKSDIPKQYVKIGGKEILAHAVMNFERSNLIDGIILVVSRDRRVFVEEKIVKKYGFSKVIGVVSGGKERFNSVCGAVDFLGAFGPGNVLIHDGARPFFSEKLIPAVLRELKKEKAAIPVKKLTSTVKKVKNGYTAATLDRDVLRTSQTPQGFRFDCLKRLYKGKNIEKIKPTDEAALFERAGYKVKIIEDSGFNIKITTREDVEAARQYMKKEKTI
ncbi:MAG: 2-C-methyl-D-erythritol 4-phosphate cytidylyltransferase [Candidatus Goldiibacteriota bacterium]